MVIKTKEEFIGAAKNLVNQGMLSDLAEMGEPITAMEAADCAIDTVFAQNQVQGIESTEQLVKEVTKIMKYYV